MIRYLIGNACAMAGMILGSLMTGRSTWTRGDLAGIALVSLILALACWVLGRMVKS